MKRRITLTAAIPTALAKTTFTAKINTFMFKDCYKCAVQYRKDYGRESASIEEVKAYYEEQTRLYGSSLPAISTEDMLQVMNELEGTEYFPLDIAKPVIMKAKKNNKAHKIVHAPLTNAGAVVGLSGTGTWVLFDNIIISTISALFIGAGVVVACKKIKETPVEQKTKHEVIYVYKGGITALRLRWLISEIKHIDSLKQTLPEEVDGTCFIGIDTLILKTAAWRLLDSIDELGTAKTELVNRCKAENINPHVDVDVLAANKTLSSLEDEWSLLVNEMQRLLGLLEKINEATKLVQARRNVHNIIDKSIEANKEGAVYSHLLHQAVEAQESLNKAITDLQNNGLLSLT